MTVSILDVNRRFRDLLKQFYIKEKQTKAESKRLTFEKLSKKEMAVLLDNSANEVLSALDRQAAAAVNNIALRDPEPDIRGNVTKIPNRERHDAIEEANEWFNEQRARGGNLCEQWTSYINTLSQEIYVPSLNKRILLRFATVNQLEEAEKFISDILNGGAKTVRGISNIRTLLLQFEIFNTGDEVDQFIRKHGSEKAAMAALETEKLARAS